MKDLYVQELLKRVGYINFKIALTFSSDDVKSEILNFKNVKDKNGVILLLNNKNSLYHRLCQAILQTGNQCLACKQINTTYDKHHIFPLHLQNFGLIEKKQLDHDYNLITVPKEFHYFLHAIRAIEYNSSKDFFITHLHFAQLIKSVDENLYKKIDFSLIYREDQVNLKFFTDILQNYSVFSPKSKINDNLTQKGLEKSIISRQSNFITQLLKNNTHWTNNDVESTQINSHLIVAQKYTVATRLFDELIDLMPENQKPDKIKTNYYRFTRYLSLEVKRPPFGWKCQEIENERLKMETKAQDQSFMNVSITKTKKNDSENRRIRTHPKILGMLDNGGYYWINVKNKNLKLDLQPKSFENVFDMTIELLRLQNDRTNITDPNIASKIGSVMLKSQKSAKYFNGCWDYRSDSSLALIQLPDQKIELALNKFFKMLKWYNNDDLSLINLHDKFKGLLVQYADSVNYLSESTVQIEISLFRELMDTRFKNDNIEFLKNSNSRYFQLCYYYKKLMVLDNNNVSFSSYSIMPDFMNNILPINFQIYKTQLKNPNNSFLTSLGISYVLQTLRFLEFGFQQDFKEILTYYPPIPALSSFLKSRSAYELPLDFGLKFNDYKCDRWCFIRQLIKNQMVLIKLFSNVNVDTFSLKEGNIAGTHQFKDSEIIQRFKNDFFSRELIWTNTIDNSLRIEIPANSLARTYDLVRILTAYRYPKHKLIRNGWSNADLLQNYSAYMRRYLTQTANFNSPFDGWKLENFNLDSDP